MKRKAIFFVIILLIGVVSYLSYSYFRQGILEYVLIDINPSIQLGVDRNEKVVDVVTLNSDADILISEMNLINMGLEDAAEEIVKRAIETGYIDEFDVDNNIGISSYSDNESRRAAIDEMITKRVTKVLENRNIYAKVFPRGISDELKAEADEYGINYGKMLLIERAVTLNPTLSKEELVGSTIREIQNEFKEIRRERQESVMTNIMERKELFRQQQEQRILNTRARLEEVKEEVTRERPETFDNVDVKEREALVKELLEERKNNVREKLQKEIERNSDIIRDANDPTRNIR